MKDEIFPEYFLRLPIRSMIPVPIGFPLKSPYPNNRYQ